MIPNIFHFVFLTDDEHPREFGLHHFMSIISCLTVNKPEKVYIYVNKEPKGYYWYELTETIEEMSIIEVVTVVPPTEIFGIPIIYPAHQSDVLRLQALIEHGGVYADIDTIFLRSYEPLRENHKFVLGAQGVGGREGICPAVIMSEKDSDFAKLWLDGFRHTFMGGAPGTMGWCPHSVTLPAVLAQNYPNLVHVEPETSFFTPSYHQHELKMLYEELHEFPLAYSYHLWETQSEKWLSRYSRIPDLFATSDTTYNVAAQEILRKVSHGQFLDR